jgi:hydroxyethylthiazole kinase-like uncharacterized protein yjeF
MTASMAAVRVTSAQAWVLHGVQASRHIEHAAQQTLAPHTLMQRAGEAIARLALALAPHAETIWIACGPGNNGGDGLEAAQHLHRWGKAVTVTWLGQPHTAPPDSLHAWQGFQACGLSLASAPPAQYDLAIDALLGLGCTRAPTGAMAEWLQRMAMDSAPILQVDMASGLDGDTGVWLGKPKTTRARRHTLSLLTLKPGLFTADGRDASGEVWFHDLGVTVEQTPTARLQACPPQTHPREHNSHKGTYGDVCVLGGAPGMTGAALLAALAALRGGAGRVYAALLDRTPQIAAHPALMMRAAEALDWHPMTVVCGCGGGDAVRAELARALSTADQLVLDADALNAIATDASLMALLQQRTRRQRPTVLTPHPLEAARLLQRATAEVQSQRLTAAQALAEQTGAVVVLKGSGTVIAAPNQACVINPSGNARLASAGTGDVLAGLIGAGMAQGLTAFDAACTAVARHGRAADAWPADESFDALRLTERLL